MRLGRLKSSAGGAPANRFLSGLGLPGRLVPVYPGLGVVTVPVNRASLDGGGEGYVRFLSSMQPLEQ